MLEVFGFVLNFYSELKIYLGEKIRQIAGLPHISLKIKEDSPYLYVTIKNKGRYHINHVRIFNIDIGTIPPQEEHTSKFYYNPKTVFSRTKFPVSFLTDDGKEYVAQRKDNSLELEYIIK